MIYNPIMDQTKNVLTLGVISKPSKRLNVFAEYKYKQGGVTDFIGGARVKFVDGQLTSTISS